MEINDIFTVTLRLKIIASLVDGEKTFPELKKITDSTDGNLGAQIKKIESANMITCFREKRSKRKLTYYNITEYGLYEFEKYVNTLNCILLKKEET